MIKLLYLNPKMLIADEDKTLTNGSTYSPVVYLGAEENSENWAEIDEADVPVEIPDESEVN